MSSAIPEIATQSFAQRHTTRSMPAYQLALAVMAVGTIMAIAWVYSRKNAAKAVAPGTRMNVPSSAGVAMPKTAHTPDRDPNLVDSFLARRIGYQGDIEIDNAIDSDPSDLFSEMRSGGSYLHSQRISLRGDDADEADDAALLPRVARCVHVDGNMPCNCDPRSCKCSWAPNFWCHGCDSGQHCGYCCPLGADRIMGVDIAPLQSSEYPQELVRYRGAAADTAAIDWGAECEADYYGADGPAVHAQSMYSLSTPDHELLR